MHYYYFFFLSEISLEELQRRESWLYSAQFTVLCSLSTTEAVFTLLLWSEIFHQQWKTFSPSTWSCQLLHVLCTAARSWRKSEILSPLLNCLLSNSAMSLHVQPCLWSNEIVHSKWILVNLNNGVSWLAVTVAGRGGARRGAAGTHSWRKLTNHPGASVCDQLKTL